MYQFDFDKPSWVHFIGIGGISMSGLAQLLFRRGHHVTGSDSYNTPMVKALKAEGIDVAFGQRAENIDKGMDLVVYTAAIHPDNPELAAAVSCGIPVLTRAEFLGQVMRGYPVSINISGTHGKTTTTSMVAQMLLEADADPTVFVVGMLESIGGNYRVGSSGNFVAEACEYTNSFLSSYPTIAVILNIRAEHLDFFKDIDDIRHSFRLFAERVPEGGLTIIDSGIDDYREIVGGLTCRIATVGFDPDDDYYADGIEFDDCARPSFTLHEKGGESVRVTLAIPGEHNISNAMAAIAACRDAGMPMESLVKTLAHFHGAHRRFEYKGRLGGVTIIDDYAHHPDEIAATLKAARKYKDARVVCVFEPHTYSRVKLLLQEFVDALSLADVVVMAEVYSDREPDNMGVSSKNISDKLTEMGHEAYFFKTFDEIEKFLLEKCVDGDLLITMGSKDVYLIGDHLLGK